MTRVKSLHHNLGERNVIFHRQHRSKKGKKNYAFLKKHEYLNQMERRFKKITRKMEEDDDLLAY